MQQLQSLKDKAGTLQPPSIEILDPADPADASKTDFEITYKLSNALGPTRLAIFLDGERVSLDEAQQPHQDEGEFIGTVKLKLPEHDALIGIAAENALGASKRVKIHVRWTGSDAPKPNLYVLAVGVTNYQDPEIQKVPLRFPVSDAEKFAATMQLQEGRFYKKVTVKVLPDALAQRVPILKELGWLKKSATNKDVVMVFMSGHGVSRGGGGYDYLPFEASKADSDLTYLHDFELKEYLKQITAKIVAFIDTCYSGNFFSSPGAKDVSVPFVRNFAEELAKASNFTVVFASSTGEELSIEREEWGHGAFTMALIEGLKGRAANPKGLISLARLNDYIAERVKELTDGKQHPMYISPTGNTNPAIAAWNASIGAK